MDIAEIGFRAETSDLEKATLSLKKLQNAAAGVEDSNTKLEQSVISSSAAIARAKTAEANATLKALKATSDATEADIKKATAALKVAQAEEAKAKSLVASANAANQQSKLLQASTGQDLSIGRKAANQNLSTNRFLVANVGAQFQDIAVTSVMGQNPLTIALQQGTQLGHVLNSVENPLKALGEAFKQVTNAVSLMTIGIIAVVAAIIQFVDWVSVAKNILYTLADAIISIGPYVLTIAASLALLYSPAIIGGIIKLTEVIIDLGLSFLKATVSLLGLPGILIIIAGFIFTWAVKTIEPFRNFVNNVIELFANLGETVYLHVKSVFAPFIEFIKVTLNNAIDLINSIVEKLPESFKVPKIQFRFETGLSDSDIAKMDADVTKAAKLTSDTFNRTLNNETAKNDYVGDIGKKIEGGFKKASKAVRDFANSIGNDTDDAWKKFQTSTDNRIQKLQAEYDALGMSAEAAEKLKIQTDLLNQAKEKGITIDEKVFKYIDESSSKMADITARTKLYKDTVSFATSTTQGFVKDMRSGLEQGKSLWTAFGNAVINVLNKIVDKIIDSSISNLFGSINPGSNAGGLLSSLGKFIFSSGGSSTTVSKDFVGPLQPGTTVTASANGNGFNTSGLMKFKNGGTFTNGIVNSPTMFAFANGGSFGVMGEAGPEAVMPLQRGPDGSLGVKMYGNDNNSGGNVIVNVNNNSNANATVNQQQTSQGLQIDVMIDQIVSDKIGKQGSSTNRSLVAYNNRKLIKRG